MPPDDDIIYWSGEGKPPPEAYNLTRAIAEGIEALAKIIKVSPREVALRFVNVFDPEESEAISLYYSDDKVIGPAATRATSLYGDDPTRYIAAETVIGDHLIQTRVHTDEGGFLVVRLHSMSQSETQLFYSTEMIDAFKWHREYVLTHEKKEDA